MYKDDNNGLLAFSDDGGKSSENKPISLPATKSPRLTNKNKNIVYEYYSILSLILTLIVITNELDMTTANCMRPSYTY